MQTTLPKISDFLPALPVHSGGPLLRRLRLPPHQRLVGPAAAALSVREHPVKVLRLPDAESAVGPEMRRRSSR